MSSALQSGPLRFSSAAPDLDCVAFAKLLYLSIQIGGAHRDGGGGLRNEKLRRAVKTKKVLDDELRGVGSQSQCGTKCVLRPPTG